MKVLTLPLVIGALSGSLATAADPVVSAHLPVTLGLEGHVLEDGLAGGLSLGVPLARVGNFHVLAEAYGYKGEEELGGIGAGVVFRYALSNFQVLEFNAFFDGLRDSDGYSYPQLGLGLAYSQSWFTARVNGYIPLRGGDDVVVSQREWSVRSHAANDRFYEVDWSQDVVAHQSATAGFDAEMEFQIPKAPWWVDPRVAVGYFYRAADDRSAVYSGPMARLTLAFPKGWGVEAEWRNDAGDIGQEYRVVVRYEIALGKPAPKSAGDWHMDWMDRALSSRVHRQPWPSVSRVETKQSPQIEGGHAVETYHEEEQPVEAPAPGECCPRHTSPLTFE